MNQDAWTAWSHIEQVTVFRLGAEVQRAVELDAPAVFPAELHIPGLPLQLRDETVQLSVRPLAGADAAACPQAVDLRLALVPPPVDPALPPASDAELRGAEHRVRTAKATHRRLTHQLASITTLESPGRADPAEGEPPLPSPTAARLELLAFRRQLQDRLYSQFEGAREELRLAQEALAKVQASREQREQQRQLHPHELRKEARITLHAPAGSGPSAARFALVLTYLVPAARWAPAYALQLQPGGGEATLSMRAQVSQKTDEDWAGVRLRLSTADALRWADLPELHPLRFGRAQAAQPSTGWRPPPLGAQALYADYLASQLRRSDPPIGGAMPPPPVARPAPQAPPEPQPAAFRRGEPLMEQDDEECFEEAAAIEEPPPARRAMRRKESAKKAKASMPFQASPGAAAAASMSLSMAQAHDAPTGSNAYGGAEPPVGLDAGRDLLDYDSLRMSGPDDDQPGKLRPSSDHQRYLELLPPGLQGRVPAPRALTTYVRRQVSELEGRALPPGHRPPARLDAFDHSWHGEGVVDVPSDAQFHAVPVLTSTAQALIHYVTVPRESQDVFRALSMKNPLPGPILAGPVDVRVAGDYLLTAPLDPVPAGGQIELGLGVEESIRVARNTRYAEQQRGVVSRHHELEHQLHIELRNLLPTVAKVEVRERVPVAREDDDQIEISTRDVQPPWVPWEQPKAPLRGAYRWQIEIEPGAVRQLRATYVVSIASKHELAGGNRREDQS